MKTLRKHLPELSVPLLGYWACLLAALYLFAELAGDVYEREGFFFDAPNFDLVCGSSDVLAYRRGTSAQCGRFTSYIKPTRCWRSPLAVVS